jgi:hypothetical protein
MAQQNRLILAGIPLVVLSALFLPSIIQDYHGWLAIGPGGIPHNVIGYAITQLVRPFAFERLSTAVYDQPSTIALYEPVGSESFLKGDLPQRQDSRPLIAKWILPQRQLDEYASDATKAVC